MVPNSKAGGLRFAGVLTSILLIGFVGVGVLRLNAQGATAAILGTVADMTGAGVPQAAAQVKNMGTGFTRATTSDPVGRFNLPDLGIGDYEVQASKPGFSTVIHKGITLTVGSQSVVDFSLPVGRQTQTVAVESQASQVEVTNAGVGSLINQVFRVNTTEFYNLFNHPQLGQPHLMLFTQGTNGGGSVNPQAGQITTLACNTAARQIQFGLKFLFWAPVPRV
jgi:hypothetical protein